MLASPGGCDPVTTVVIVDNDQYVCDSLQARLGREPDFECVGTAGWPEAARKLAQDTRPDLIVLDIMLGGGGDPIDLAADLIKLSPASQIVVCTAWSDSLQLDREQEFRQKVRASRNGVTDWVSKGSGINELVARLREAAHCERAAHSPQTPIEEALGEYLGTAASIFEGLTFRGSATELSPAEIRVAAIVARGLEADLGVEEIARMRRMVPGTVRGHLKSIYLKWNVHNQAAFVAEARRRGLLGDS
jgi:DNA-binding NarL/FixJ family response regulator